MNDPEEPLLLDHEADGIRELDNKLPRWWVWLFYISIAFAAVYLVYYHVVDAGDLQADEYRKEMERGDQITLACAPAMLWSSASGAPTAWTMPVLAETRSVGAAWSAWRNSSGSQARPHSISNRRTLAPYRSHTWARRSPK